MDPATLVPQLEELYLLQCSLLSGEHLSFIPPSHDADLWESHLQAYPDAPSDTSDLTPNSSACFQVKLDGARIWLEVNMPLNYPKGPGCGDVNSMISIRGDQITRSEQERWQAIVKERTMEVSDKMTTPPPLPSPDQTQASKGALETRRYHALLTSHHLISPTKRRNLQHWSSQLSVTGFAKVGYPGVIYCEGEQAQVEEFVGDIKAMQWLALKVRFVEPVPDDSKSGGMNSGKRWVEFEKVGEVVEEMRRVGRESYVVEMGIGSAATSLSG